MLLGLELCTTKSFGLPAGGARIRRRSTSPITLEDTLAMGTVGPLEDRIERWMAIGAHLGLVDDDGDDNALMVKGLESFVLV